MKRTGSKRLRDKSIVEMTNQQCARFLLKPESYCNVDLPAYFQFGKLLTTVSKELLGKPLQSMSAKPREQENVNYAMLSNKDGRHAWRPFQLIHPALYVSLVDQLTSTNQWKVVQERFKDFQALANFACLSVPVQSMWRGKTKQLKSYSGGKGLNRDRLNWRCSLRTSSMRM